MNRDVMGDLLRRALSPPSNPNITELIGRAIFWIALVLLSWSVVLAPIERSQMAPSFVQLIVSRVNLVFHEAGHVIFSPLGQFMGHLGGLTSSGAGAVDLHGRVPNPAPEPLWSVRLFLVDGSEYVRACAVH